MTNRVISSSKITQVIFNKQRDQGGLSHKWTWWIPTPFFFSFHYLSTWWCSQTHQCMMFQHCHLMASEGSTSVLSTILLSSKDVLLLPCFNPTCSPLTPLLAAILCFFCATHAFFTLSSSSPLSCLSASCVSFCLLTYPMLPLFQERRMRVPTSSVALPQAAVAPPLAELTCVSMPVYLWKRLSQSLLPETSLCSKSCCNLSGNRKKMHATRSLRDSLYNVNPLIYSCIMCFVHLDVVFSLFAIYFCTHSHIKLSEHITIVCSLLVHSCFSRFY